MTLREVIDLLKKEFVIFQTLIVVVILIILINIILRSIKGKMLKRATSKSQISHIKFVFRIIQSVIVLTLLAIAFFYHVGSWTGLGIFAGLITAALGFALQKPITGVAAWIIIMFKRPFNIGDRIKINNVKGEVYDITPTHLYLDEIGGDIEAEDYSGRNVIVPNHLLFEYPIINYTLIDDFVLSEVLVKITYESNLDRALELIRSSVEKFAGQYCLKGKREIKLRVLMDASSITVHARFFIPVKDMARIKSDISTEIYQRIKQDSSVDFAYPHTEFVMKNKDVNLLKDSGKRSLGKKK